MSDRQIKTAIAILRAHGVDIAMTSLTVALGFAKRACDDAGIPADAFLDARFVLSTRHANGVIAQGPTGFSASSAGGPGYIESHGLLDEDDR